MSAAHARSRWGADFDPDRLALLELRMWKAYYRRQPARLFGTLVLGLREQAHVQWPRALIAAVFLTKAAVGFARATGDYERFAPDVARGYRWLGLPGDVDVESVAREELRWWVVRREIGLAAGSAAGETIARLYAALYNVPVESVAEAGRLRGIAAEVRDRGAIDGSGRVRRVAARPTGRKWLACSDVVSEAGGSSRLSRRRRAGPALDVVRSAAHDPPGDREQPRGEQQLDRVADEERREARRRWSLGTSSPSRP